MRKIFGPPLRAAALVAFVTGVVLLLINPPSSGGLSGLLALLAGALALVLVTAWATVALIGPEMPEPEFRRLVDRSEALAALPPPDRPPSEFDELVMEALDDLPDPFRVGEESASVGGLGGHVLLLLLGQTLLSGKLVEGLIQVRLADMKIYQPW